MGGNKPYYMAAFVIQATYAGMILVSKAAFNSGMSTPVFVFYRQFAGTLLLAPFAIILHRKNPQPLSLAIFSKMFMLAFVGITLSLNIYGLALVYTSANLGATTINCLPVTTFALAVLLRMEKVKIRTAAGMAKVAGIAVCIVGVAVFAFYKGPHLKPLIVHHGMEFGDDNQLQDQYRHQVSSAKRILGCLLLLITSMTWGLWTVLQAKILKIYPSKLAFTSLQCISSSIQSFLIAIAFNRDLQDWKLAWDVRLLSILYCGILVNGLAYYLLAWVVEKKGPVFVAMTTPLTLVMTILGSIFLLGEVVNLGSVLGGVLLVMSLYSVLWGKSKEEAIENQPVEDEDNSTNMKETEICGVKQTSSSV